MRWRALALRRACVRQRTDAPACGTAASDKAHWVEAGRRCERFALQAFLNQAVEVFGLTLPFSMRRPVPAVLA